MPKLSPKRAGVPLLSGLELLNRGKVRDLYQLPDGQLLMVATDGLSIFDFVLNALVPMKGAILTALSVFWFQMLEGYGIETHMIAFGAGIDEYLPKALRGNIDLQSRALVVKKLEMVDDIEFVFRGCITGSALDPAKRCGHVVNYELQDGDRLPYVWDTPTTKAKEGRDEAVDAATIRERYPLQTMLGLRIFEIMSNHALSCGLRMADAKYEFSRRGILADEAGTPDAARYWLESVWQQIQAQPEGRKAPPANDKEEVRHFGRSVGINKLDPKNPNDVATVHAIEIPDDVIAKTTQVYRYLFWLLTGQTVERYQQEVMGVRVPNRPAKKVAVVCDSESDLDGVLKVLKNFNHSEAAICIHVMSCHRNPAEVFAFAKAGCDGADVVIGVGGKALALPGILDAVLAEYGHSIPVVGVALGDVGSLSLSAAQLSIEEVPGAPLVINEVTGRAYDGLEGLDDAVIRVISGELPPVRQRKQKPVRFDIWSNEPVPAEA